LLLPKQQTLQIT